MIDGHREREGDSWPAAEAAGQGETEPAQEIPASGGQVELIAGEGPAPAPAEAAPAKRHYRIPWREIVETALLAFLVFLAVRASFQNFRVEGASMDPSLDDGEYLIVNKLAYATIDLDIFDWLPFFDSGEDSVHHLFGSPGHGDVVVFKSMDGSRNFIKRIIAVSGDRVEIHDGAVFLNGERLVEDYARSATECTGSWCSLTVPEGQYFVLGDNRSGSTDSRAFGLVPEKSIIGKAFFSYWPPKDAGLAPNHSISYAED